MQALLAEFGAEYPNLLEPLLRERDRYMAHTLRNFCAVLRQRGMCVYE
jgi:pheromone shutdown protein TraB